MDFVFCMDKNYIKGFGVLMLSILRFAPPPPVETLRFHILSDGLDNADKQLLEGIATRRENTQVCFYSPAKLLSEDILAKIDGTLENRKTLSRATFYRLLVAELLPRDVHKALYLDGDVICTGSLVELFRTDTRDCPVGMCFDQLTSRIKTYNRLGYSPSNGYFNAGVVLFNLDLWRKENLTQVMLDYLSQNAKRLVCHDQDVLNAVLHGRIFQLDFSYNIITTSSYYVFYWLQEENNKYYADETQFLPKDKWDHLKVAAENPRILHFSFETKPWYRECNSPFAHVWRYFYAQSPWKDEPLQWYSPPTLKAKISRLGRKALEALHLVSKSKHEGIPYPEEMYRIAKGMMDRLEGIGA